SPAGSGASGAGGNGGATSSSAATGGGPAASGSGGNAGSANGGSGGATSATSRSGGGGTGGGPVVAGGKGQVEMPVLAVDDPGDARQPSLVVLSSTPASAAVVYASQVLGQVTGPVGQVGSFDAWAPWPPSGPVPVGMTAPSGVNGPVPGVSLV